MLNIEAILALLDSRSFGSIWFWVVLILAWTLAGRHVLGVPTEVVMAAHRAAPDPDDDPAALLLLDWLSLTLPRRELSRGAGVALIGMGAFALTTLAVLGFVYGLEMAQALVLLTLPFALIRLIEMRLARHLSAILRRAETGLSVSEPAAEAARMMRRHRLVVTLVSILAVALTTFYGVGWMLAHPFG
ncbi:hypothetical protein SAMN04487972_1188 [Paracoccus halophilus]|uniref:Component of SufBCD complex n=1 Tax=Paracoccus halophilus TaxID=376733 RepID=A0A099EZV1_9RHOB|nr:hypothetical protein [Paracoccus halophilus]KGJ03498.1 hypothetical protein IT41_13695 [Paracoccus halophilus]SFA57672.1 hypothetical protein SAMN04487972_1188 [Paracoccus halophilus]